MVNGPAAVVMKPPPCALAELPEIVLLRKVSLPMTLVPFTAPPLVAELPERVQLSTVVNPVLKYRAPPLPAVLPLITHRTKLLILLAAQPKAPPLAAELPE